MSIYGNIFRYSPSTGRSQLENFLTESLCDLLGRLTILDRKGIEAFVLEALVQTASTTSFREHLQGAEHLRWATQHTITVECGVKQYKGGIFDLCLFADNRVLLVVEVKIAASFTSRLVDQPLEEEEGRIEQLELKQLELYDRWIAANAPDAGLILLTHLTPAPTGFLEKSSDERLSPLIYRYRTQLRAKSQWAGVYSWLINWCKRSTYQSDQGVFFRLAAFEFLQFLEEKNLDMEIVKASDLELLGSFFSNDVRKKLRLMFDSTRKVVTPLLPNMRKQEPAVQLPLAEAWTQTQISWDWGYCYKDRWQELGWYVGWGLAGSKGLWDLTKISLPDALQAFVLFTADYKDIPATGEFLRLEKQGWKNLQSPKQKRVGLITIDVRALAPGDFNASFQDWVVSRVRETVSVFEEALPKV